MLQIYHLQDMQNVTILVYRGKLSAIKKVSDSSENVYIQLLSFIS